MAAGSEVLREYLLSLGFRVNSTETRKFEGVLDGINKRALLTGGAIVGVAAATAAMVNGFAAGMEKLYYASRRSGATVSNLQAVEFGARSIGLQGGQATNAIIGMAAALRRNPGLTGLLNQLGVRVEGRDMSDVASDTVRALKQMPFYVAAKFGAMFGFDEDTLFMMQQGQEKMDEMAARRRQMAAEAGVDSDAAAEAAVRYRNLLSETTERASLLKDALAVALLPTMERAVAWSNEFLTNITRAINGTGPGLVTMAGNAFAGMFGMKGNDPFPKHDWSHAWDDYLSVGAKQRALLSGIWDNRAGGGRGALPGAAPLPPPGAAGAAPVDQRSRAYSDALFARMEKQYGVPASLLDSLYSAESSRGRNTVNPNSSARGPFQFLKGTRKEYGIDGMEDDLDVSADAAARKMQHLLRYYGGDVEMAVTAWHFGEGNFAKKAGNNLGATPSDTQEFTAKILGGASMTQNNHFELHGSDPRSTAKAVGNELNVVNGNLVRDLSSSVH